MTTREQIEAALQQTQAQMEDLERSIADLDAGYCDHGHTCEGTTYFDVKCSDCYQFTYNGATRGIEPETSEPFTCVASELLAAIKRVKLGVNRKSCLPVLSGVLFNNGELTTTDMDTTLITHVDAAGSLNMVAPVAMLEKVLGKVQGTIILTRDGLDLQVDAGSRQYTLKGYVPEDFPQVVAPLTTMLMQWTDAPSWRDAWRKLEPCTSKDTTRPILCAVSIGSTEHGEDGRTMVATDSYRLGAYKLPDEHPTLPAALVGRRACEVVAKLKGAVSFGTRDDTLAAFRVDHGNGTATEVYSRAVEGQFPSRLQLTPDPESMMSAAVDREDFLIAVDAVSAILDKKNPKIVLGFNGTLKVSAESQDVGSAREYLEYTGEIDYYDENGSPRGELWEAAYNPAYLADGLASVDARTVVIDVTSPLRPAIIRGIGDTFTYLIMPIANGDRCSYEQRQERNRTQAIGLAAYRQALASAAEQTIAEADADYALAS